MACVVVADLVIIIVVSLVLLWYNNVYLLCGQYDDTEIPEARFSYDLSPMAVMIVTKGKKWYEFITSICALIGGTFTVLGLLSGFLSTIFKAKKI